MNRDWPEDFNHENGRYQCHCCRCGAVFTGHKRRVVCKACATATPSESERPCPRCACYYGQHEDWCDFARPNTTLGQSNAAGCPEDSSRDSANAKGAQVSSPAPAAPSEKVQRKSPPPTFDDLEAALRQEYGGTPNTDALLDVVLPMLRAAQSASAAPMGHDEAHARINECFREIEIICDSFGYDPAQWLVLGDDDLAPLDGSARGEER